MSVEKPYIFISHSSKNNDMATKIAEGLRDAGFNVWLDLDSIPDGSRWLAEIQQGVEECGALLILMSREARKSHWVEREALLAMELRKPLFMALIEDVPLPLHLIDRQFTDFRNEFDAPMSDLVQALKDISLMAETDKSERHPLPPDVSPEPTENNFFDYLRQLPDGEQIALVASDLYYWAKKASDQVEFTGKQKPAFHARINLDEIYVTVFTVRAFTREPAAEIPFEHLMNYPPYDRRELRLETLQTLNDLLPGDETFSEKRADRRPTLPLKSALESSENLEAFKAIAQDIINNLRKNN